MKKFQNRFIKIIFKILRIKKNLEIILFKIFENFKDVVILNNYFKGY